jgi:hypothetical protein
LFGAIQESIRGFFPMIWGLLVKGRRVPREARVKALSSIFKEAQKSNVDSRKHTWIVQQWSEELESIPVGIYGIHDLLSRLIRVSAF